MKRVLIYVLATPRSGITMFVLNYLNSLKSEYEFDVLSRNNDVLEKWCIENDRNYFELNISNIRHPIKFRKYLTNLFINYDIVHFHMTGLTNIITFKIAKKLNVQKIILHSHNTKFDMQNPLRQKLYTIRHNYLKNQVYKYGTDFCACSMVAAKWMFGQNISSSKIVILKNAINYKKFKYDIVKRKEFRDILSLNDKKCIVHIGRYTYQKNHEFLIRLFSQYIKEFPDTILLLIGDGPNYNKINEIIIDLNISQNIIRIKNTNKVNDYLQAADLFILPSKFEGLPISAVEAQASGLPCVLSSEITEETKIIENVKLVSLNDSFEIWIKIINDLLKKERKETYQNIKNNGYDFDSLIKQINNLYSGE